MKLSNKMKLSKAIVRVSLFITGLSGRPYSTITSNVTSIKTQFNELKAKPSQLHPNENEKVNVPKHNSGGDVVGLLEKYKTLFPADAKLVSHGKINLIADSIKNRIGIRIGIIYDKSYNTRENQFIELMLIDPLSSDTSWFQSIRKRSFSTNNLFKYNKFFNVNNIKTNQFDSLYEVPSPSLNKYERNFPIEDKSPFQNNNLELLEINDFSNLSTLDHCHFYMYVTSNSSLHRSDDYNSYKPVITIIDNDVEYTPISNESTIIDYNNTNIIKINSKILNKGITQLLSDPSNGLSYYHKLQQSNILSLLKVLDYYSDINKLTPVLIESIKSNCVKYMDSNIENNKTYYMNKDNDIKRLILKFSEISHHELQFKFKPLLHKFFLKNLNWYKLYYKNDNIEYDLSFFLQLNYMQNSIENYNFINGKISNITSHNVTVNDEEIYLNEKEKLLQNPMIELRNETISQLSALQNEIIKLLSFNFITYQFPLVLLSTIGLIFNLLDLNSMISISSLGIIIGLNNVSKDWIKIYQTWEKKLIDDIRFRIKDCEFKLVNDWNSELEKNLQLIDERDEFLKDLNKLI